MINKGSMNAFVRKQVEFISSKLFVIRKKLNLIPNNYSLFTNRGFSLIELLVAISIIAMLTTLAVANFVGVRERGRDAQRKASVNEIRAALEFYKIDQGAYPLTAVYNGVACGGQLAVGPTTYMQKLPCDPATRNRYVYTSAGDTYELYACLENERDPDDDTTVTTCGAGLAEYRVLSP